MKFKPGQSGNPAGKPKGVKDRRTELRALLVPHAQELIDKVVALAKAGDTTALRILIDRLIPPIHLSGRDPEPVTGGNEQPTDVVGPVREHVARVLVLVAVRPADAVERPATIAVDKAADERSG